jgi:hypothetical protein
VWAPPLVSFCIFCDVMLPILLTDVGYAGAYNGGDADTGLHQMVHG